MNAMGTISVVIAGTSEQRTRNSIRRSVEADQFRRSFVRVKRPCLVSAKDFTTNSYPRPPNSRDNPAA